MFKKILLALFFTLSHSSYSLAETPEPKISKGKVEITLTDGSTKVLTDEKACPCYIYKRFIDLEDVSYYVFDVTDKGAEGAYSILVDNRTGEELKINGIPVPSPDKKRFVTVTMDLSSKAHESKIEVWDFKSAGSIQRNFDTKITEWGVSDPVWVDNTAIRFYKNFLDQETGMIKEDKPFIFLKLKDNKWQFEEDQTSDKNATPEKK